jgi:hypothetical protein
MVYPHIDFVSTAIFPLESDWQTCLDYITAKDIREFRQVVGAESYLTMLMDGGTLRLFYSGLTSALGSTIQTAFSRAVNVLLPRTPKLKHISWDSISIEKLSVVLAVYLGVSKQVVLITLLMLQDLPSDQDCEQQAKFWMTLMMRLESTRCGIQMETWTEEYHRQQKSLSGAISSVDLAKVMLHKRSRRKLKPCRQPYSDGGSPFPQSINRSTSPIWQKQ